MGTPIIDHYGDLVVSACIFTSSLINADDAANHRTGESCTLTFKPRGWRGSNAQEIKGTVHDTNGSSVWDIAGRTSLYLPRTAVVLTSRLGYTARSTTRRIQSPSRGRHAGQRLTEGVHPALA